MTMDSLTEYLKAEHAADLADADDVYNAIMIMRQQKQEILRLRKGIIDIRDTDLKCSGRAGLTSWMVEVRDRINNLLWIPGFPPRH